MSDDEVEYNLMVPFVVCTTQGGPYDDTAFAAGSVYGAIRCLIEVASQGGTSQRHFEMTAPTALVPQLDLLALEFGYHFNTVEHDVDWVFVFFDKIDDE